MLRDGFGNKHNVGIFTESFNGWLYAARTIRYGARDLNSRPDRSPVQIYRAADRAGSMNVLTMYGRITCGATPQANSDA